MKTRHKITLLFSLLVTAILLVVSLSVYYFSFLERRNIFQKRLFSRANNNAQIFSYVNENRKPFLDRINMSAFELLPDKSVEIYGMGGNLIYEFGKLNLGTGFSEAVLQNAVTKGQAFYSVNSQREALAVHYPNEGQGIVVVVAAYDNDGWTQLQKLRQIFGLSLLIGTLISLIAGHVFSKQLLKPVAAMIHDVNEISSHNLSNRLNPGVTNDELSQLSNTFNDLLDRLQEYFTAQRRFISNASHELSTPLTSISSQLEVTLQRDRSIDEYRQVMHSVQEDVVQLSQLTKSLLEIAKTGGEGSIELKEIRIDEVLFKIMGDIRKSDASYGVELNFSDNNVDENSFLVFGNSDLLYIAVKNVVENGCKYSPDKTSRVQLSFENEMTVVEVESKGEPIAEEDRQRLFQPFYRASSSAGVPGFGLGLALAQRIIGLHKGSITVRSNDEASNVFVISLPSA